MGDLSDEVGLHPRRLLGPFVGDGQFLVLLFQLHVLFGQLPGGAVAVDEEEGEEEDEQQHCGSAGDDALVGHVCRLLRDLGLLLLCLVDDGQLCRIVLPLIFINGVDGLHDAVCRLHGLIGLS